MMTRKSEIEEFILKAGWGGAQSQPITGDASTRSYTRLIRNAESAILMDAPPAAESSPCPPTASPQERQALGYNACARLAGPNLNAFTALAKTLRRLGLNAPEIVAHDHAKGFALISDLGDALYARAINNGEDEFLLYEYAIEALLQITMQFHRPDQVTGHALLTYDETAMLAEVSLLSDWYIPYRTGETVSEIAKTHWRDAWGEALQSLSAPHTLVLRDFHAENLLWLPQETGLHKIGVIDFQDGLFGQAAYDVVSLLEDARRDVSPSLRDHCLNYYFHKADQNIADFNQENFLRDYALLGAQRNAKILGIFARLIKRDNKPRYADFFPRVEAHFKNNLTAPALAPVKNWIKIYYPELVP